MSAPAEAGPGLPPQLPPAPRRPSGNFVGVLAWISIALGILGILYALMQVLTGLFLPSDFYLRMLNPYGGEPPPLPPLMYWIYTHTLLLGLLTLAVSTVFLWVSWAVLKRREWGRKAFIALLVLGTLWQFGSIGLLPQILEGTLAAQAGALPPGEPMPPALQDMMANMMTAVMVLGAGMAVAFGALHAWIIWKLCRPEIRAEFTR